MGEDLDAAYPRLSERAGAAAADAPDAVPHAADALWRLAAASWGALAAEALGLCPTRAAPPRPDAGSACSPSIDRLRALIR